MPESQPGKCQSSLPGAAGAWLSTICGVISLASGMPPGLAQESGQDPPAARSESAIVSRLPRPDGRNRVVARVLIHASPEVVWDTVHAERRRDPDLAYAKILAQEDNQVTLEEKFVLLPLIGTAVCVMKDTEVPLKRIDYRLIESDHFKAMEGSWVLSAVNGGRSTILELSTYLDLGLPLPRLLMDGITAQKLQKRLNNVKLMSERSAAKSSG